MDAASDKFTTRETYLRLLSYLRGHRMQFAMGVLGAIVFALASASFGQITKVFLDGTFLDKDPRMLQWAPIGIVLLFILRGGGDFVQNYYMGLVGRSVIKRIRTQLFDRLLCLPISYFDRNASAIMLSRLIYNTEQVASIVTDSITTGFRETLTIVGAIIWLFILNAKLTLIVFVIGPIIAWLITIVNRQFRKYSRRIQDSVTHVTRVAKEALDAPRVIKVFNAQEYERQQFEVANEYNRRSSMKLWRVRSLANPVVQAIASVALAVVLYVATNEAIRKEMTVGQFTGFLATLMIVMQPLRNLVNISGPFQQGIAAGQSLFEILDEPVEPSAGTKRIPRVSGDVEYRDVSFNYQAGNKAALNNISLKVKAGSTVALVGRSGSGKSTLVNLLPRFYQLEQGDVLVDGHDIREYDLHSLREQIALVSQDVVLFDDTIRNNIAFGKPASAEAIERAAKAAHVLEFANQLPQGLETTCGERGVLLSGGQKQRISIARALLKDAPILILDEATSALDTESERVIQAALEDLMQNRTTLVIAHRLSTIEKADCIVVMDGGRIVEQGTHAELIAANGSYAALHRMQFNV